eukprot:2113341-Rhodomonas_salina.1
MILPGFLPAASWQGESGTMSLLRSPGTLLAYACSTKGLVHPDNNHKKHSQYILYQEGEFLYLLSGCSKIPYKATPGPILTDSIQSGTDVSYGATSTPLGHFSTRLHVALYAMTVTD